MSFRNGKMNVRWFRNLATAGLPEGAAELFAKNGVGPVEHVKELAFGWSTYDSLFDGKITEDNAWLLEFLRLNLVKATKKVPATLLRAEVQAAIERRKKETGKSYLLKQERKEIKAGIRDMLLGKMPPHLSGCELVHRRGAGAVATEALSIGAADRLAQLWRATLGPSQVLHALTPDVLAKEQGFEARQVLAADGGHERAERTLRAYRLYLAGCAMGFEQGWLSLHQVLAARPDGEVSRGPIRGAQSAYPFHRGYMYPAS